VSGKDLGWLLPDTLTGHDLLCVTLKIPNNLEYRAAFMGAIHMLEVWFNWEKTGDTRAAQAAAYWRSLIDEYLTVSENCGGTVDFRQNPDDSCQLQYSNDGGATWLLAFDYGLCIPPVQQTILDTVLNNNTYVNPFSPTISFVSQTGYTDEQKQAAYNALCYACQALVAAMSDTAYQVATNQITAQNLTAGALLIAGGLLLIFDVVTLGAATPWCLAITGAALALYTEIAAVDPAIFNDTDNRAALACLALANLANRAVSLADFQAAFTGADCLTSDQQTMAAIFTSMLQSIPTADKLFTYFVQAAGDANGAAQGGLLTADCGCDGTTWCYDIFPSNSRGVVVINPVQWGNMYTLGVYGFGEVDAVNDRWNMTLDIGNPSVSLKATFYIPAGCTLTEIGYGYNSGSGTRIGGMYRNGTISEGAGISWPNGFTAFTPISVTGSVEFRCYISNNTGSDASGYVTHIHLEGTGVNPFAPCDNC